MLRLLQALVFLLLFDVIDHDNGLYQRLRQNFALSKGKGTNGVKL